LLLSYRTLQSEDFSTAISDHFDKSFELKDAVHLVESIVEIESRERNRLVPPEIRQQARNRYHVLLNAGKLRRRIRPIGEDPRELLTSLRNRAAHDAFTLAPPPIGVSRVPGWTDRPKDLFNYRGCEIGTVPFIGQQIKSESLRELCTYSFRQSYSLDRGIPYLGREINPNILVVNRWPEGGRDPLKPVRAAAFAGWAFTAAQSSDEITLLLERLQKVFATRVR
jgi:hypothetical protein